jgi:hypothetical protein
MFSRSLLIYSRIDLQLLAQRLTNAVYAAAALA